jgi:hypothetical protein
MDKFHWLYNFEVQVKISSVREIHIILSSYGAERAKDIRNLVV